MATISPDKHEELMDDALYGEAKLILQLNSDSNVNLPKWVVLKAYKAWLKKKEEK